MYIDNEDIMSISYNNLYCVENKSSWLEPYQFSNKINFVFWNNTCINIESNSIDVVIIMVMLHHINDETIAKVIENVKRLLKPNGILIIKEHHCNSLETKHLINWEHHLYTLTRQNLTEPDRT